MPDPSGPDPPGAHRPPAGRMTRDGRPGPSPAPRAVAGRTVAGGLCSGDGGPSPEGPRGGCEAWRRRAATLARVSGIFGSHPILGNVARQDSAEREIIPLYCPLAALNFFGSWDQIGEACPQSYSKGLFTRS